ncbi:YqhV family protein [Bacillus massiliglaciei]|uniref:YqhV family protein n=1 Tax=Bacillus massiliglaciei TaxID=1816693 RepID=UPI000DA63573|nr:YqhV family protein [Bacillus massiliglaciei]
MFIAIEKAVLLMGLIRLLSGSLEIFAALLMLKFNDIEKALMVNSSLALIGPFVLMSTTAIGLVGVTEKLSLFKLLCIMIGVTIVFIGIKSK